MQRVLANLSRLSWSQVILFDLIAVAAFAIMVSLLLRPPPVVASDGNPARSYQKQIAFSFDDTPRGAGAFLDVGQRPQVLIAALKEGGVAQAAFFANPGRISTANKGAEAIDLYATAGHVIANHTSSHVILSSVSAETFLADVDLADNALKTNINYRPWLRFPRLDEGGCDKAKRDAVRAGMRARGIRHGYVTADGWDWYLESMTIEAKQAGKMMDISALRKLYVETHVESAEFSDRLARRMFAKPPVQMMLLHETDLAALFVADLAKALRAKGWQIVAADEVYADPLARIIPDSEVTNGTWLEMMAWEKKIEGGRWFPRNDVGPARKLFDTRVLHE